MIRVGIVGVGRQGSKYVSFFRNNNIKNATLTALCDIDESRFEQLDPDNNFLHYKDYNALFADNIVDAIIIDTPHYLHPIIALKAVEKSINVLSDKPLGVDALTVKAVGFALEKTNVTFGVLFNQRQMPIYKRIKDIIDSGKLGKLKRCVWEITDWYRPQKYYDLGGWRSSWKGEGGGVLINQCVHNIDMIIHFFGTPNQVNSSIGYGVYHKTEIDDSVVANLIYDDGFTCTLISSTGETPGTNRLEISGTNGKLIFDSFGVIKMYINEVPEDVYSKTVCSPRYELKFGKPKFDFYEEKVEANVDAHILCIQNFIDSIIEKNQPSADYSSGLKCVELINAIYLSDWLKTTVTYPVSDELFYSTLKNHF